MTKQYKWQMEQREKGLCRQCGKPAVCLNYCASCREKNRVASRNYHRKKRGIPLDAPLAKKGRPRLP